MSTDDTGGPEADPKVVEKTPQFKGSTIDALLRQIKSCQFQINEIKLLNLGERFKEGTQGTRRAEWCITALNGYKKLCEKIEKDIHQYGRPEFDRAWNILDKSLSPECSAGRLGFVISLSPQSTYSTANTQDTAYTKKQLEECSDLVSIFKDMVKVRKLLKAVLDTKVLQETNDEQERTSTNKRPAGSPLNKGPPPKKQNVRRKKRPGKTVPKASQAKTPRQARKPKQSRKAKPQEAPMDVEYIHSLWKMREKAVEKLDVVPCQSINELADKYENGRIFLVEDDVGFFPGSQNGSNGDNNELLQKVKAAFENITDISAALQDIDDEKTTCKQADLLNNKLEHGIPAFFKEKSFLWNFEKKENLQKHEDKKRSDRYIKRYKENKPQLSVCPRNTFHRIKIPLHGGGTVVYGIHGVKQFYIGLIEDFPDVCSKYNRLNGVEQEVFTKLTEVELKRGQSMVLKPGTFYCSTNAESSVTISCHYLSISDLDFHLRLASAESEYSQYHLEDWLNVPDLLHALIFYIKTIIRQLQNATGSEQTAKAKVAKKLAQALAFRHKALNSGYSKEHLEALNEELRRINAHGVDSVSNEQHQESNEQHPETSQNGDVENEKEENESNTKAAEEARGPEEAEPSINE